MNNRAAKIIVGIILFLLGIVLLTSSPKEEPQPSLVVEYKVDVTVN